ncbi:MAG: hypothetical protein AB1646_01675 [Thermodesulfobacteriota bacterium]
MKDSLKAARSLFRIVMVLCGALAVFAAATESTNVFTEAKRELEILSRIDVQALHRDAQKVFAANIKACLPHGLSGVKWPCKFIDRDALHVLAVARHELGTLTPWSDRTAVQEWAQHARRTYVVSPPPSIIRRELGKLTRPWSTTGDRNSSLDSEVDGPAGGHDWSLQPTRPHLRPVAERMEEEFQFKRTIETFAELNDGPTAQQGVAGNSVGAVLGAPAPNPDARVREWLTYLTFHVLSVRDRPLFGDLIAQVAEQCQGSESFSFEHVSIKTAERSFFFDANMKCGKEETKKVHAPFATLERSGWSDKIRPLVSPFLIELDSMAAHQFNDIPVASPRDNVWWTKTFSGVGSREPEDYRELAVHVWGLWENQDGRPAVLPKCRPVWHLISDKTVNSGIQMMEEKERSTGFQLRFIGAEMRLPVLVVVGPLGTLVCMLVLASYVSHLWTLAHRLPDSQAYEITTFPWEALFDEPLARAATWISLNVVPAAANLYFLSQTIGKGVFSYGPGQVALVITMLVAALGTLTYHRIEKLNAKRRQLEKMTFPGA